jgi:signal transduction histidine kinase/ActR/RegA family two-component response regulator
MLMCEWWNTVLHDRDGQVIAALSLAMDITEKHEAETALRYSQATQSALLDAIPDLMFRIRADGTYLDYNAPREEMFFPAETFLGLKIRDVLPEEIARRTQSAIAAALETGQCQTIDYELPIGGVKRYWEARIAVSGPAEVVSLVRDITEGTLAARQREDAVEKLRDEVAERHRAELDAKRAHDLVEMIRRAQASFIMDEPLSKVFDQLLGGLLTQTESAFGLIGEVKQDLDGTTQLIPRAISEMNWRDTSPFFHERSRRGGFEVIRLDSVFGQVVVTGRPVLCNDPASETAYDGMPSIRAFLGLPFYHRDELVGMVGVANREGGYDQAMIESLQPLLTTCASIVQAHRNDLERQRMEVELQASKEAAETANRSKDHFLAVLSHELRTPLTPVLAAATSSLDDPALPAEIVPAMEMIRRNIQLESRLIDDLLDVSRIGRGALSLHSEIVDLHALIAHALEVCEVELKSGGLNLRQDLRATRYHVKGDPARLQQAIWNLVKNAVKFTPAGGIVSVRSADRDGRIEVEVGDTGIGIPAGDLERIFVAFEQGHAGIGRPQGLGLGLAITRSIIEAHEGAISVSSPGLDGGAVFTIELATVPRVAASSRPHLKPVPSSSPDSIESRPLDGLRILLVEDNRDTLRFFSWILDRAGCAVTSAVSVADAVQALQDNTFDLVVSDIELPDGSGADFMREHCVPRGLQAIAMSGFGSDEDVRRSLDAGFLRHLTKPLEAATLVRAVRQASAPQTEAECR